MTRKPKKSTHPIAKLRSDAKRGLDMVAATKKAGGLSSRKAHIDTRWIELGERIRAARLARGWTQSILARKANWSQSDLSDLERGQIGPQGPSLRTLTSIADALAIELPIGADENEFSPGQVEIIGEVRRATPDFCTANAMFTSTEWELVKDYATQHVNALNRIHESHHRSVLWTLDSDAELRNLVAPTRCVITVIRGGGSFNFLSGRYETLVDASQVKIAGILDVNDILRVRATGNIGLMMMMVPFADLFSREADDELACTVR